MKIDVRFYQTAAGAKPVAKYMRSLDKQARAALADALFAIQEKGIQESGVSCRQIDGRLWEIRPADQRAFYVLLTGAVMVVLHAYKKEGQKAPKKEVDLATKRMNEVIEKEKAPKKGK